jgi:small subunit ribosomal protein S17
MQAGKTKSGLVIGKSGDKSIRVAIDHKVKHPRYGKYINRRIRFGVHDEHNQAGVGDVVEISRCRPYSKSKSWRLVGILKKAAQE